jgi:MFS family permease
MSLSQQAGGGLWSPQRRTLTVGLVLTITLVAFEALAVSTILPIVADELGGLELYGWVFTSFMLASLIGIVVAGALIDRRGLGLPFAAGLLLFAIGLLIGGLAPSMPVLIVARFIQGLGAGTMPPIAYVAIGRSLPERLRPRMFATLSTAWVLPGVIGPAVAGVIADTLDWRIVFLGMLPLIGIAGGISYPVVRRIGPAATGDEAIGEAAASASLRRRLPLALLVALGTGLFLAGVVNTNVVVAVTLIVVGGLLGLRALRDLTPPGTLRLARGMPTAIVMRGLLTFVFFAVDAYVALTLIGWRGQSATEAGLSLTAATMTWTAGSWIQARMAYRWAPERFVRIGLTVVVVGIAAFSIVLIPEVSPWMSIPTFGLAGLGMGLAYAPLTLIVLRESAPTEQGSASAALSLTDSLGAALGTGVTGAIVAISVRAGEGPAPGLAAGFAVAFVVGLLAMLAGRRLRTGAGDARAAALVPHQA